MGLTKIELTLKKLLDAAGSHDEDASRTVDNLQDLLRTAWFLLPASQKIELLNSGDVENLEDSSRGAFEREDLITNVRAALFEMQIVVTNAGYQFRRRDGGFIWESADYTSQVFKKLEDAVASAYEAHGEVPGVG